MTPKVPDDGEERRRVVFRENSDHKKSFSFSVAAETVFRYASLCHKVFSTFHLVMNFKLGPNSHFYIFEQQHKEWERLSERFLFLFVGNSLWCGKSSFSRKNQLLEMLDP
jgi:hypothetical protein